MSQYIDGFLVPVPRDKIDAYQATATRAAAVWKDHGALEYRECVGEDLDVEGMVSFPKLADAKADETVVFAYVVFASKQDRDAANKKIMADPRIEELGVEVGRIFDCSRMAFGGFQSLVHEQS